MRVFIVDPHPLFREGLRRIADATPDLKVIGEAARVQDLAQHQSQCEVVTLDGEIESMDFLRGQKQFRDRKKKTPFFLILSRRVEPQHVFQLLSAGADGYASKCDPITSVVAAMRQVGRGKQFLTEQLADVLMINFHDASKRTRLSQREHQVLHLFGSGLGSTDIAKRLSLSIKTVSTYRSRLLEKLKARNNGELIRYAVEQGIVS